jgi:uncharacterized protein YkwD
MPRLRVAALLLLAGLALAADDGPTDDEREVLQLVNAERQKESLPPVKHHPLLMRLAREHSAAMARTGIFSHVIDEQGPGDRAKQAGYRYSRLGENIAHGTGLRPKDAMKLWMQSEGHRDNILRKEYRQLGVGIHATSKGERYYTQVFGTERKQDP